jgi:hypothetical protein
VKIFKAGESSEEAVFIPPVFNMGISASNAQVEGESMASENDTESLMEGEAPMKETLPKIDESRLLGLMKALQRFSRLQQEAANAQIDARQKMREVGFKRRAVWISDAAFMREVQRRMAQAIPDGFEELMRLATECQTARDNLGPLEQEGIEAEQHWEGAFWKLRQAEEKVLRKFEYEFQSAKSHSSPSTSASSSQYESSSEDADYENGEDLIQGIFPHRNIGDSVVSTSSLTLAHSATEPLAQRNHENTQNTTLLGLDDYTNRQLESEGDNHTWDSDSGIGDIDRLPDPGDEFLGPPQSLPQDHHNSIELYPHLLTGFGSRRDRINRWLQHTTLVSRFEANLLKDQLALENPKTPSNWSQLVIAYWELDGAARPTPQRTIESGPTSQHETIQHVQPAAARSEDQTNSSVHQSNFLYQKLWSPTSSNPDHGYFSDFRSRSRERLKSSIVPLRLAPRPPQSQSISDTGREATQVFQDPP